MAAYRGVYHKLIRREPTQMKIEQQFKLCWKLVILSAVLGFRKDPSALGPGSSNVTKRAIGPGSNNVTKLLPLQESMQGKLVPQNIALLLHNILKLPHQLPRRHFGPDKEIPQGVTNGPQPIPPCAHRHEGTAGNGVFSCTHQPEIQVLGHFRGQKGVHEAIPQAVLKG